MKTVIRKLYIILFLQVIALNLLAQTNYFGLEYIENKGQWDNRVNFKSNLNGGAIFLRKTGFTLLQHNSSDMAMVAASTGHGHTSSSNPAVNAIANAKVLPQEPSGPGGGNGQPPVQLPDSFKIRSNAYYMDFVGSNQNPTIIPDKAQPTYNNYIIGNDPSKWTSNCKIYQAVTYKDVYPNIDVRYYSDEGWVKYEFVIHPGGDPSKIAMRFDGIEKLSVSRKNELQIKTSVGDLTELPPYTYQYNENSRQQVDCKYVVEGNTVKFKIKNYSRQSVLVIDPTLIFASLSGSSADNWGFTATYGKDGSLYGGGIVFGNGFPVSPGAYQTTYGSGGADLFDMGIIKLNSTGNARLYATYIGGSGKEQPHSMFEDPQGNLVIAGRTNSTNYPSLGNNFGPLGSLSSWDIVVTKLNANGTGLVGSARIGGGGSDGVNVNENRNAGSNQLVNFYGDDARSEVIIDPSGNIYVASSTMSTDFYTTAAAQQTTLKGTQDAVLLKLNAGLTNVLFSTYLGGSGFDAGFVLALDPSTSNIYMAGGTTSSDFPGNKAGTIQPIYGGGTSDGYIAVFSNDGSTLIKTTYLGTSSTDVILGIQFDKFNFPYVMGITFGNWPVVNAAYSIPNSKQFVGKLKEDLSGWEFSTVFGTGSTVPNMSPVAFLVDRCQNMYISGWGGDFENLYPMSGVQGMPTTPDAIKLTSLDNHDFYFIVIKRNAAQLLYGTFFGQDGPLGEHVDGGTSRFDQNGTIYQGICANCVGSNNPKPRWPVTPGAWCCSNGVTPSTGTQSGQCNLGMVKIAFNFAGVAAGVRAYINGVYDTTGCVPLDVVFRDTVLNAQLYIWNYGDGSPEVTTKNFEEPHTYTAVGDYRVRLIAIDSNSCNFKDTAYVTVRVRDNQAMLDFAVNKIGPCLSNEYRFDNTSVAPAGIPFGPKSFSWDFGDGTKIDSTSNASINHSYAAPGTYKVSLTLLDTSYCNAPQIDTISLRVSPLVKAQFEIPNEVCAPFTANFNNTSLAGQTFEWDFGDGTASTAINPTHLYATPGTYIVRLKAFDPATCNLEDSAQQTISVRGAPTAAFTYAPTVPAENVTHVFTNNSSSDAVHFVWYFGDGDSLSTNSRADVDHEYNSTGTFNACLFAYNQIGCVDSACQSVQTIVSPRVDVPNAFTPTGPNNNIIYIRGFAIGKMRFIVYNRWGQKLFESNSKNNGWDGRFKGVVQPMDVYAYTLEVEFTDGTRATKKGDITLIR